MNKTSRFKMMLAGFLRLAICLSAFFVSLQNGWGLTVQVSGPDRGVDYSEFRLSFVNDDGAVYREQEIDWVHRMAEVLYAEGKNRSRYPSAHDMTLSWRIEIAADSPVSRGWHVSRGSDAVFVRHGPVGGESWRSSGEDGRLLLSVKIPSHQLPETFEWDALEVSASYVAREGESGNHEATTPVLAFPSVPTSPRLQLTGVATPENGSALQVQAAGEKGFRYRLERSTDLGSWDPVGEWKTSAGGELSWQMETDDAPAAFYRVRVGPDL